MSNTQRAALADIPELTTTGTRKVGKADRAPFRIDGVTYHLIRPKDTMLAQVAGLLDSLDDPDLSIASNRKALLGFAGQLLQYIEQTPPAAGAATGRAHIEKRLADPTDDLELADLLALFNTLMQGWYQDRPTGKPRASTAPRRASVSGGSRASTR